MAGDAHGDKTQEEPQAQDDPFEDQVACARYRAERDALAQRMEEVASESDLLLDCPFCGGRPYVQVHELDETCVEARVVCPSCHVSTVREYQSWGVWQGDDELTRTLAIGRAISCWNRRAERTRRMVDCGSHDTCIVNRELGNGDVLSMEFGYKQCSKCGLYVFDCPTVRYCPNCGARVVSE